MENNILYETEHWKIILADDQYHLGRCVIDVKRNVGALRNLTKEEWTDLEENVITKLENTLIKVFGTEMFNWVCLMNNAYKPEIEKPHPHIHFHLKPRYRNPVKFAGETFHDKIFGHHYDDKLQKKVSQEVFNAIREKLLEEIEKN